MVASQLPWLLFALVSGAVVDRLDRRVVMLAANFFRACAMVLLGLAVLTGFESLVLLYVVVFLLGSAETLFDSASFALLPALVDESELERANGPLQATVTFNQEFVGPPLGALLFAFAAAAPFFVDAASFALAAGITFTIKGGAALVYPSACESPAPLSHIGSGTCVPLSDPAPALGRQWVRYLCPTKSTSSDPDRVITCAQPSQGGRRHAGGAFDG